MSESRKTEQNGIRSNGSSRSNGSGAGQRRDDGTGGGGSERYRADYGGNDGQRQNHVGSGSGGVRPRRKFVKYSASLVIEIDSNKAGLVIGRGGTKIHEIQDNFNVHVRVDRTPGPNGCSGVSIKGEEAAIQQAKQYIQNLVAVKQQCVFDIYFL